MNLFATDLSNSSKVGGVFDDKDDNKISFGIEELMSGNFHLQDDDPKLIKVFCCHELFSFK